MPDAHDASGEEDGQQESASHLNVLRAKQDFLPFRAVREYATYQREKHNRDAAQKRVEPQQKRRPGKLQHQPSLCESLHQRADARGARADPHDAEVAVCKASENSSQQCKYRLGQRLWAFDQMQEVTVSVTEEDEAVGSQEQVPRKKFDSALAQLFGGSVEIVNRNGQVANPGILHALWRTGSLGWNDLQHGPVGSADKIIAVIAMVNP